MSEREQIIEMIEGLSETLLPRLSCDAACKLIISAIRCGYHEPQPHPYLFLVPSERDSE